MKKTNQIFAVFVAAVTITHINESIEYCAAIRSHVRKTNLCMNSHCCAHFNVPEYKASFHAKPAAP